ncbi:MAG: protein-export chaperone SecB [Bacteroidales bacterium]|nr:protein-export chaperone SecB [Bacteroidales bacterium]
MEAARFALVNYKFDQVFLNLEDLNANTTFAIDFKPSGVFYDEKKTYELIFLFSAVDSASKKEMISIRCKALYSFKEVNSLDDIPSFFYNNAIAILFPYVRAFVSTVTLQANIQPLVLPTLNLSDLQDILKANTKAE